MRLSTIFYLYRVRLRARLVQELLAVAGIAVGVALLFASQVANTSLTGSVTRVTNGLVGSARLQLTARDSQGFNEGLLSQVEALRGVRTAVPVLQRSAYVVGPRGRESVDLVGLDAGFVRLQGRLLSHVSATQLPKQQGLALPAPVAGTVGAAPLESLSVHVGDMSTTTQVAVILQSSDIGELVDSGVAIAPLGLAQRFAGMQGRVSRILVEPQPGRDREVESELMRIAAGRLNVLPANFEAEVFRQAEAPTAQSTQMFSAISALVGFLFAFNAMLLTVPQRRSLIADLRLDGYTPAEILEVMLFDVFALGVVGIACGLALGELLSRSLLQAEPGYLSLAFPVESLHIVSWQNIAIAAAGGILAAVIGVMVPLRHEIFRNDQVGQQRAKQGKNASFVAALIGGVGCVALTAAVLIHGIATVGAAILAFVSLMLALLLIMPAAFGGLLSLVNGMQRGLMGVSSRIALIELMSSSTRSRSLAIAATGAIAVFGCVAIEGARNNLSTGLSRAAADVSLGTDLWVSPAGSATTLATTPFKDAYGRTLRRLASVSSVGDYRGSFLDVGNRRVLVVAPPSANPNALPQSQVVSGDPNLARTRVSGGGWIAISRTLANQRKVSVGGSFDLASPVPMRFRVAAILTNLGWAPGAIVMNPNDYARAWDSGEVSAYQVTLKRGVPLSSGLREVQLGLGPNSGLVVQSATQHKQNDIAAQKQGLARLTQIAALVLVAAALAMAAAMGAMIWQRRPRLAGMKVDGFSQGELWRALIWETGLLLVAGCAIGAVFGLFGQLVLSHALVSVTGFPVVFSVAIPVAIASLAIIASIALVMVAMPGYFAAQVKPALQDLTFQIAGRDPMPEGAFESTSISIGQGWALAIAVVRELFWGLRSVLREVERWQAHAAKIPDATIREDALAALKQKRPNTDGAALFLTVTASRCPRLLRLLVAYEIMADFLDSTIERGAHMGIANGRQLHLALVEAVDVARPISDYFRHHPWRDDGGYLPSLVEACRYGCMRLPSYWSVRPMLMRAAALAQVQGLSHELDLLLRDAVVKAWVEHEGGAHDEIDWYETAGAASAWLTVLALMAVAAEPASPPNQMFDVYSAYFPWFSLTATLLDSYGDLVEDKLNNETSYIARYGSLEAAVQRIDEVMRRATVEAWLLDNGARHSVVLAAMIAMYLSKDSAVTPDMKPMSRHLLRTAGPLATCLGPVLRAWRVAFSLREA